METEPKHPQNDTTSDTTSRMIPGVGLYYDNGTSPYEAVGNKRLPSVKVNPSNSLLIIFVLISIPSSFFVLQNHKEAIATLITTGKFPEKEIPSLQIATSTTPTTETQGASEGIEPHSEAREEQAEPIMLEITNYSEAVTAISLPAQLDTLFPESKIYSSSSALLTLSENEKPLLFIASSTAIKENEIFQSKYGDRLWILEGVKLYSLFESKKQKEAVLFLTQIQKNHAQLIENGTSSQSISPFLKGDQQLTKVVELALEKKLVTSPRDSLILTTQKLATPPRVYKKYAEILFEENKNALQKSLLEDPRRKLSDPKQATFFVEHIQASKDEYLSSFEKHMNACKTPDEFDASFSLYLTKLYAKDAALGQNSVNSLFTYWNMVVENITPLVGDYCIQQKKVDNLVAELQRK